ncbi:MAG: hypothetical protein WBO69_05915 [Thermoanaerobaculia bacterium]
MTSSIRHTLAVTLLLVTVDPAIAGSYLGIAVCMAGEESDPETGCHLGFPKNQQPDCQEPPCPVTPNGITHPIGYTGTQTNLTVNICVDGAYPKLVPVVDAAIEMWERLEPRTYNCWDCGTWERPPSATGDPYAFPTVLHELGHCALGLTHVDRLMLNAAGTHYVNSSFTRSAEAGRVFGALDDGLDDIRGSGDDYHTGILGPAEAVSWFRVDDNDPFIVDPLTTIDIVEYTTARARLPAGDDWGASANMCVFDPTLCDPSPPPHRNESQSVMYSAIGERSLFFDLSADDVNMLQMARTGKDRFANTADDYTLDLVNVGDCSQAHQVKITMGVVPGLALGVCEGWDVDYSFTPIGGHENAKHFSMVPEEDGLPLLLKLNIIYLFQWDYAIPVFASSFEIGDTSDWSTTSP